MAHHPRPVHREIILETLWGELDFQKAYQNFKVTLGQLRRALEPDLKLVCKFSEVLQSFCGAQVFVPLNSS